MAVEARHLNLQLIQEYRDVVNPSNEGNANPVYSGPQMLFPFAGTLPGNQSFYQAAVVCDSVQQAKTSANTDSDLTYNLSAPPPRKRSRNSIAQFYAASNFPATQKNNNVSQIFSSLDVGEDILSQIQQQYHLDIDTVISQHTKKIRLELQERQKQEARLLVAAIGEGVMKKLKEKEEQIQRMGKLKIVLEERVKSLYVENQLWREVAQTNEATANSLRTNLEQLVLAAHVGGEAEPEDVESCCGSSDDDDMQVGRDDEAAHKDDINNGGRRWCRRCGERESCVLLLPCRHLCLCNVCGCGAHQLRACPVCHSPMNATLHLNMSST